MFCGFPRCPAGPEGTQLDFYSELSDCYVCDSEESLAVVKESRNLFGLPANYIATLIIYVLV